MQTPSEPRNLEGLSKGFGLRVSGFGSRVILCWPGQGVLGPKKLQAPISSSRLWPASRMSCDGLALLVEAFATPSLLCRSPAQQEVSAADQLEKVSDLTLAL